MNYLYLGIIISQAIAFITYFLFTKKVIKQLLDVNLAFKQAGEKAKNDLYLLTEQYRQLANINKAMRDIQTKGGKKK